MKISVVIDVDSLRKKVRVIDSLKTLNKIQSTFQFSISERAIQIGTEFSVVKSLASGKSYISERRKMSKSTFQRIDTLKTFQVRDLILTSLEECDSPRRISIINWEEQKKALEKSLPVDRYFIIITDKFFIDNWFSHEESFFSIISVYKFEDDFKPIRLEKYLMYQIAQACANFSAHMSEKQLLDIAHISETTGCMFDLVENKYDIKAGINFGYICHHCEDELLSMDVSKQAIASIKNILDYVAGRKRFEKVFVVHGHDIGAREQVAHFVESLGFEAIILCEQTECGNTIIEQLECHSNVDFAIIIYSPCDVGGKKEDNPVLRLRARQNVILEHGYFIGKLGRKFVNVLHIGDIELPSDVSGMLYTNMDKDGAWKEKVKANLKAAGYISSA